MLDSGFVKTDSQPIRPVDRSRIVLADPPPPKEEWVLTPESFDGLLAWLDPNRDHAAEIYEEIRSGLIKRFRQLGCQDGEDLANETFDRVAKKLPQIAPVYKGDRAPYFFSVAYYVHKERQRKPVVKSLTNDDSSSEELPDPNPWYDNDDDDRDDELLDECLKQCLERLSHSNREMILQYYRGERNVKIKLRKELAAQMGIKVGNLRLKAQRIRVDLKKCILDCMEAKAST